MKEIEFKLKSQQLTSPNVSKLMRALTGDGAKALFVGGCIRDLILQIPPADIDIAIDIPPEQVIELLNKHGITNKPLGIEHGSVLAIINKEQFNITTLRTDVETFGRSAKVEFIDDWELDANRRDFTINALYADEQGNVYDPVNGYPDIINHVVKFIGSAQDRIQEDYLRILRYFRFYTYYGKEEPDSKTLSHCQKYASKLAVLSPERNWSEFKKILSATNPAHTIDLMSKSDVLQVLLPGINLHESDYLFNLTKADKDFKVSPIRRLAAIIKDNTAELKLLRLSNNEINFLNNLLKLKSHQITDFECFVYKNGVELSMDIALLTNNHLLLEKVQQWQEIAFPVNGNDLINLGLKPGKDMGSALLVIEQWWLSKNRLPDKDECLTYFKDRNKL